MHVVICSLELPLFIGLLQFLGPPPQKQWSICLSQEDDTEASCDGWRNGTHISHLQVPVPSRMNPPRIPPITGPNVGPRPYRACAPPLSSFMNKSPILAPPKLGPAEPAMPLSKRRTARDPMLGASAHPTLRMANSEKLMM